MPGPPSHDGARRAAPRQPRWPSRTHALALTALGVAWGVSAWASPAGAARGGGAHREAPGSIAADPWAAIPLRWSVARALLTSARCETSPRARRACVHAVEAALRSQDDRLRVRPASLPLGPREEHVRTFGAATVTRQVRGTLTPADEAAARALVDAWDAAPPGSIPFERLAAWVAARGGFARGLEAEAPAPHEASVTASAVQAFLRTSRDPFARLVPRVQDDLALESAGAARVGIGATLLGLPGVLLVERVAPDGPAARAGVQPGDVLSSIDGWDLAGVDARDAAHLLQGPDGAPVRVGLYRDGQRLELAMRRARILVRHAFGRVLHGADGALVGYLRVASLHSERVCGQATRALGVLVRAPLQGIVLDLRGNPGGLVEQARCVADLFLSAGLTVATLKRDGDDDGGAKRYATQTPARTALPLVTLVDGATTSAAELLAAALRAHERTLVVGERTYGKATVQDAFPWAEGLPVVVYRTVGTYVVGPQRAALHLVGLVPDVQADALGRDEVAVGARRATWRYWEALRRPPAWEAAPAQAAGQGWACRPGREAWMSVDGEAVGPQLARAASATRCAPGPQRASAGGGSPRGR